MVRDYFLSRSSEQKSSDSSSLGVIFSLVALGAVVGATITFRISTADAKDNERYQNETEDMVPRCTCDAITKRERLPLLVILVRHGESEGNVDKTAWWRKADHDIELTDKGKQQAADAGKRIEAIFSAYDNNCDSENLVGISTIEDEANENENKTNVPPIPGQTRKRRSVIRHVHLHVSPFERTKQTAKYARPFFDYRVTKYKLCPRLREQEFGNLQGETFQDYRQEQSKVGRFWYRFPTGESGADVLDRVKSWWEYNLIQTNNNHNCNPFDDYEWDGFGKNDHHCDAVVVFSHGLTLRSILCQLFKWSISTFHSVYNAKNCDLYVLKRDLNKPGHSPYVLDGIHGDLPKSSIDVCVTLSRKKPKNRNNIDRGRNIDSNERDDKGNWTEEENSIQEVKIYKLLDYLSIPAPRMSHTKEVKNKLVEQYPEQFKGGSADIESVSFLPFHLCNSPKPRSPQE